MLRICSTQLLKTSDVCGLYDAETDTILISLGMTYTQKRCTLVHELVHREHGDVDGSHEMRTRLETAKILIDPKRLAVEETMYGTDYAQIADDLDVTPPVLLDFRAVLA
jgi:hypothetical protein